MAAYSKLAPVYITCVDYVHPWTQSCSVATAGLILQAFQDSFRIYAAFYSLSLLMRFRLPSWRDLCRTVYGIMQSTAFLTTSAFSYCFFLCIIREIFGSFNFWTFSYVPAFLSSLAAILIERPSRRNMLCLYVTNVATETLWNMSSIRGYVPTIKHGQVLIFGISTSILLTYLHNGLHNHKHYKDSIFDLLQFFIGKTTVDNQNEQQHPHLVHNETKSIEQKPNVYGIIKMINYLNVKIKNMSRHHLCTHNSSCLHYGLHNGAKMFSMGCGIQIALKLLLQINNVIKFGPIMTMKRILMKWDTLKLGIFLGGFSSIYRWIICLLRHWNNNDKPQYAFVAGLIASISFASYPDITVALYVMWKMLQISYNIGVDNGWLPNVPNFTILLYCASTATLFHAATMEPLCLRQSYWKFLHSLSGGRVAGMAREPIDIYGYDTTKQLAEILKRTKTNKIIRFTL